MAAGMVWLRRSLLLSRLALLLAVAALAGRSAVPQGFMLAGDNGLPRLVLCPEAGPVPVATMPAMDHGAMAGSMAKAMPHHGGAHEHNDADHRCPFAAAAFALDVPVPLAALVPAKALPTAALLPTLVARPGLGLAAPPPWPTGPPSQA